MPAVPPAAPPAVPPADGDVAQERRPLAGTSPQVAGTVRAALRAGTPSHARALRSPVRRDNLSSLRKRLGQRDQKILEYLFEHRCLTTHQICDLFFDSPRTARERMRELFEIDLVRRFQPQALRGEGSYPFHYVLGPTGARLVAALRGVDVRTLGYRKGLEEQIAFSPKLLHLLDVNTFFSRLEWVCRRRGYRFEWWSEPRCLRRWGSVVRPDGYGVVRWNGAKLRFFLEMDRGTERPWRLSEKLPRYSEVALSRKCPGPSPLLLQRD
ncbi:MAG: replication-relaxation family protein [Actinomycetota bacterium]